MRRPLRSLNDTELNITGLVLLNDSPLGAKAADSTDKLTNTHRRIVQTLLQGAYPPANQHKQTT